MAALSGLCNNGLISRLLGLVEVDPSSMPRRSRDEMAGGAFMEERSGGCW